MIGTFLGMIPFLLVLFVNYKINMGKAERRKQVFMPLIALAYSLLLLVSLVKTRIFLYRAFEEAVSRGIPALSDEFLGSAFIFAANTAIVILFGIVKFVLLPIFRRKLDVEGGALGDIVGQFYEKGETESTYTLKVEYWQASSFFKAFFASSALVSSGILALSQVYREGAVFKAAFYPVFGLLVLGETVAFLDGSRSRAAAAPESPEALGGEGGCDFEKTKEDLLDIYGSHALYVSNESAPDQESLAIETRTATKSARPDNIGSRTTLGSYFSELKKSGIQVDPCFARISESLLAERNVIVFHPFYRDLTQYLVFPIVKNLLEFRKCLVILGRDSSADDVCSWMRESITDFTNAPGLWRVEIIDKPEIECDVAILKNADLYNLNLVFGYTEFLASVGIVLVMDPSRILATGQLALNHVSRKCANQGRGAVFCALDKNSDGLVDCLSHTLRSDFTEVVAPLAPTAQGTRMVWDAKARDLHGTILQGIYRYLGFGTEISAIAIKNRAAEVTWIGSEKFPVLDMHWIAGQYFLPLCEYAGLPREQSQIIRRISARESLWGTRTADEAFMVVEDEFDNLFEILRLYSTRARKNVFVNLLCEEYLLRDYMIANAGVFLRDPKAIPAIVPDYARTERNTIMKIMMMLYESDVREKDIVDELLIGGLRTEGQDILGALKVLAIKHCQVENTEIERIYREELLEDNLQTEQRAYFTIKKGSDTERFAGTLRNCYFIIEDEKRGTYSITSMLYNLVYQTMLPGQFITVSGKHYQVQTISDRYEVILRRAADHIQARRYYRQERWAEFEGGVQEQIAGATRKIAGMEISHRFFDLRIGTSGYYDMGCASGIEGARYIEVDDVPIREYKNKSVLEMTLSAASDKVRYTLCLMFNELFRSIYPDLHQYVFAAMPGVEGLGPAVHGLVYSVRGGGRPDSIYFVEDSQLDLGLVVSVERNIERFLEIIADLASWYGEPELEPAAAEDTSEDEDEETFLQASDEPKSEPETKRGLFGRIKSFMRGLGGRRRGSEPDQPQDLEHNMEGADFGGDEEKLAQSDTKKPPRRKKDEYLHFGYQEIDACIDVGETLGFLRGYRFDQNLLRHARDGLKRAEEEAKSYDPRAAGAHFCDFCGLEMKAGSFTSLEDGRERCPTCSESALKTLGQLKEHFEETVETMERLFRISIDVPLHVRMTSAKKIAKHQGTAFVPTPGFDARVVGFARRDFRGHTIFIENGAPVVSAVATIVHEVTHIWQYRNWDDKALQKKFGKEKTSQLYEGMATWAEIQYLRFLKQTDFAHRLEIVNATREDDYGKGFRLYLKKYPLRDKAAEAKRTPFGAKEPL